VTLTFDLWTRDRENVISAVDLETSNSDVSLIYLCIPDMAEKWLQMCLVDLAVALTFSPRNLIGSSLSLKIVIVNCKFDEIPTSGLQDIVLTTFSTRMAARTARQQNASEAPPEAQKYCINSRTELNQMLKREISDGILKSLYNHQGLRYNSVSSSWCLVQRGGWSRRRVVDYERNLDRLASQHHHWQIRWVELTLA